MSSPALAAFKHRGWVVYQAARFLFVLAVQILGVAVGWQVYEITGRKLSLGLVGLAQFLPAFLLVFVSGHVADRFDRRRVLVLGALLQTVCAVTLSVVAKDAHPATWWIYSALVVAGVGRAFSAPAGGALMPSLVPTEDLANAVAWSSTTWQLATIAGPGVGGLLYEHTKDPVLVYRICIALEALALVLYALVPRPVIPQERRGAPTVETLLGGVRYLRENKIVLGAISLDLFAVLLGGAVALLPAVAKDVLHTNESGFGWLRSAPAIGATLTALVLAASPMRRHSGKWMFACVAVFGLATIAFGLSSDFGVSLVALFVTGAADMVSVYVRQTLVQVLTPDAMRGRVGAVNQVFVGASNELGEFESGVTGEWLGTRAAIVAGGIGTLVVVALWTKWFPQLRDVDRLDQKPV